MKEEHRKANKTKRIILCIVACLFIMGIAGAVIAVENHRRETEIAENTEPDTTDIAEKNLEFMGGEDLFVEGKIESTPITLSDKSLASFEKRLSAVQPAYEFSDLYQLDEALKRYKEKNIITVSQHAHDVRVGGELDADTLYDRVLRNNDAFMKTDDMAENLYDVPKKKEIRKLCEWICEVLPEYETAFPEVDMDTVCCNLYDLKILTPRNSFSNADIDQNNIFNFDWEQMENNAAFMDTEDIFKTTFYHEMIHACQICCDCYNNGDEWRVGMGNDYKDAKLNPLAWYWLNEAAAEELESSYLGVPYSTYDSYIGYLTSLDFIAQLRPDIGANRFERLTLQHDMEEAFRLFELNTEEERREFLNLMYSVDTMQLHLDSFYDVYKEKTGVDFYADDAAEDEFRLRLKDDVLLSMTKLFYRNLARQINRGDVTLQDMFYLLRLWEAKLGYHCSNEEYGFMVAFTDFYKDYTAVQDDFFKMLAEENNVTAGELIDGFEQYRCNIQDGDTKKSPNADLTFFDDGEKKFLKKFTEEYYWTGRPSMRRCITVAADCRKEIAAAQQP